MWPWMTLKVDVQDLNSRTAISPPIENKSTCQYCSQNKHLRTWRTCKNKAHLLLTAVIWSASTLKISRLGAKSLGENWIRARFFWFVIGSPSFVHPPNCQKYWFFTKKNMGNNGPWVDYVQAPWDWSRGQKHFPPNFWLRVFSCQTCDINGVMTWKYWFFTKQNMHEKEQRDGHVMVTSIWSHDENLFSPQFLE